MRARVFVLSLVSSIACGGRAASPEATVDPITVHPIAGASGKVRTADAPQSDAVPGDHRLQLVARHGVPVTNATGVACAGAHVWLATAGDNVSPPSLAYVHLTTSAVEKQFALANLAPAAPAFGITLLGGFLYVSVMQRMSNAIVRVDPATGAILQRFAGPAELGPPGLDVSGGRLVESDGTSRVFTLSPTGAVLSEFSAGRLGRNRGVAVRGSEAFVGSMFGGMDTYDVTTGAHLGIVTLFDGTELREGLDVGSMCFNGSRLLILSKLGISEYEVLAMPAGMRPTPSVPNVDGGPARSSTDAGAVP